MESFIRTDERLESIKSLEKTIQFLEESEKDIYQWKWFLISLHNALQCFMVLALKGSNSLKIMKTSDATKWMTAYESGSDYPITKLDFFMKLFEKIQSDSIGMFTTSQRFESNESIDTSVKRLNEFRNRFIHFMPKSWSLEIIGLPGLALDVLEVIEFLFYKSGNVYFYEEGQHKLVEEMIGELKTQLIQRERKYVV
ncbi:hypothetical protein J41TS12_06630 [Paenibacillus antibioticophila]|uniref:Uncharacterized protein n=1 Tax=Paenibacillus antibioticophila TaxID=1274374 RepID=A0A920CGK7_9BACL|nr:hypothetical protein [Paenibacillus antibioticophila]GIO35802.1 hypothetical protein J41TS12_06630 [Paenibacillus antibioticophila]